MLSATSIKNSRFGWVGGGGQSILKRGKPRTEGVSQALNIASQVKEKEGRSGLAMTHQK